MAYVRPISKTWYLANRDYTIHMVNEMTSFFVAILALVTLWGIAAVAGGADSYQRFLATLSSPLMLLVMLLTTLVMFYHAVAWFSVTPKAMPIQMGEDFVADEIIAGAHYVVWAILSLVVLILAGVF